MILQGKTINFLGDSITESTGASCPENGYVAVFERTFGLKEARNYGVGGSRFASQEKPWGPPRMERNFCLRATDMDENADAVVVFGGTNDSWSNAPLGNEMSEGWERTDLYNVLPAIGYFFTELRRVLPDAKIYGICNCDIKNEVRDAIRHASERVGGKAIVLESIDKLNGHPTPLGMVQIKDQVLAAV